MDARGVRRSRAEEEEESYFVSMADMMVGLLFIFLILLLYFALQFRQTTATLTGANEERSKLLKSLEQSLKEQGLEVTVDEDAGVLRLPDEILFETGQYRLSDEGRRSVAIVAKELGRILPCYSDTSDELPCRGRRSSHQVESIFIEGHTDTAKLNAPPPISTNLELSALRATETFKAVMAAESGLASLTVLRGARDQPIFGVSGYGETRLVDFGSSPDAMAHNRRIDLRFLMVTPKGEAGERLREQFGKR